MRRCYTFALTLLVGCGPSAALHDINPYTPGVASNIGDETFVKPIDGLTKAQLEAFARGRTLFDRTFTPQDGLGPLFNNTSCKACHGFPNSGGGSAEILVLIAGETTTGAPRTLKEKGGPIISDRSVLGIPPEQFPAETKAISKRISPPTYGEGLIEAIPAADIRAQLAYSARKAALGINGKVNLDVDKIGRFGWKAQTGDMVSFTVTAANFEMGLTSPGVNGRPYEFLSNLPPQTLASPSLYGTPYLCFLLDPTRPAAAVATESDCPAASGSLVPNYVTTYFDNVKKVKTSGFPVAPDLTQAQVDDMTAFQRLQAPPPQLPLTRQAEVGKGVFGKIGCAECHTPEFKTGANAIGIPAGRTVALYSDLLLHDMGPDNSDGVIWQGIAKGADWRTTPLWGLRHRRRFWHDGRTDSLEEAIQWHQGEGARTLASYNALSQADRDALKMFVLSI